MADTPVAIFTVDVGLLERLETAFGPPIDSYLMGWQVWLVEVDSNDGDDAVEECELEYRLHPPGGFTQPVGLSHHDLWDEVIVQAADGAREFRLGEETRPLDSLWVLLEVYPAFGEDVTADQVRGWAEAALGRPALAAGTVDHERIGGRFTRGQDDDLPAALRAALGVA